MQVAPNKHFEDGPRVIQARQSRPEEPSSQENESDPRVRRDPLRGRQLNHQTIVANSNKKQPPNVRSEDRIRHKAVLRFEFEAAGKQHASLSLPIQKQQATDNKLDETGIVTDESAKRAK